MSDVETGLKTYPGSIQREPVYRLDGVRHEGGVNLAQAFVRNGRTCRSDAKGETQAQNRKSERTDAEHRGALTRSSGEVSVTEMERRGQVVKLD